MKRTEYSGAALRNISFPLGGIGTGCIGLAGNGRLIDWEIFNTANKASDNGFSHFAVRVERDGKVIDTRVLNGDIDVDCTGQFGKSFGHGISNVTMAGFPHFRNCVFRGEYPLATLEFDDSDFPGQAELTAFNPLIPLDSDSSSLPVAMFSFKVKNTTDEPLDYILSAVLRNPRNNSVNTAVREDGVSAVFLDNTDNTDTKHYVSSKSGNTLGDDHVDLAGFAIGDHSIEIITFFQRGTTDALVGIDAYQFPLWMMDNEILVIFLLQLE